MNEKTSSEDQRIRRGAEQYLAYRKGDSSQVTKTVFGLDGAVFDAYLGLLIVLLLGVLAVLVFTDKVPSAAASTVINLLFFALGGLMGRASRR
ncbi:MAG: hypothetical protein ACR2RE_02455 [Geminicoccaceae bacterium]